MQIPPLPCSNRPLPIFACRGVWPKFLFRALPCDQSALPKQVRGPFDPPSTTGGADKVACCERWNPHFRRKSRPLIYIELLCQRVIAQNWCGVGPEGFHFLKALAKPTQNMRKYTGGHLLTFRDIEVPKVTFSVGNYLEKNPLWHFPLFRVKRGIIFFWVQN